MKSIVSKGKTIQEAITNGLAELGISREQADINVLDEPQDGFIGIFGKQLARVEIIVKDSVTDVVKTFLENITEAMKIEATVTTRIEDDILIFELSSPKSAGILIGKKGQTLDALQYLASLVGNKGQQKYVRIALDIESYREKRKRSLMDLADRIALNVEKSRGKHALEPMNPYERKVIHASLQNYRNIATYSIGDEPNRYVVIEYQREQV
ncbi:MAG: protein jag [Eubacteriaceae bacterium]|nr:protein jag [Eubacteriaceae bacterium]